MNSREVIRKLALFCFLVIFVSDALVFKKGYEINAKFNYVSIIDKGAPVRMAGVRVGVVKKVNFSYEEETQKPVVNMVLFIDNSVVVRKKTKIMVRGTTPLSEPHIEIMSKGIEDGIVLEPGATIRGVDPISMDEVVIVAEKAAQNLETVLARVRRGKGTVGELFVGDELYNEMLAFVKDLRAHPWKLLAKPKSKGKGKFLGIF